MKGSKKPMKILILFFMLLLPIMMLTATAQAYTTSASSGFSPTQGQNDWYYQQWNGSSYSNMTWDAGNGRWKGTQTFCLIMSDKQHPDTYDSVRKWVAPSTGFISVSGIAKKEISGGDGVKVSIKKNNLLIWGTNTVTGTNTTGISHNFQISVAAGDALYFIVNKNGDNSYDTTVWNPTITYVTRQTTYTNSVLPGVADPMVMKHNNMYYLYGTNESNWNLGFKVYYSSDMVNWTEHSQLALTPGSNNWGTGSFWAPEVKYRPSDGYFYMFYTADNARLYIARSSSPLGPFTKYSNGAIFSDWSLDSSFFIDDNGQEYMYYAKANMEIRCAVLSADLKSVVSDVQVLNDSPHESWITEGVQEAPFVFKRKGVYYLLYSGNGSGTSGLYGVGYATSSSPTGPFTKSSLNPILWHTSSLDTTGHCSVVNSPDNTEAFIAYHGRVIGAGNPLRSVFIDRLQFAPQQSGPDLLQVVGPTNTPQSMPAGSSAYSSWESYNYPDYYLRHQNLRGRVDMNAIPVEDREWKMVPGLADSNGVSFESINYPGRYLRTRSYEVWLDMNDGTQSFKNDATFYKRPGLKDASLTSFESKSLPGYYIRHINFVLFVNQIVTDMDKSDATFRVR